VVFYKYLCQVFLQGDAFRGFYHRKCVKLKRLKYLFSLPMCVFKLTLCSMYNHISTDTIILKGAICNQVLCLRYAQGLYL